MSAHHGCDCPGHVTERKRLKYLLSSHRQNEQRLVFQLRASEGERDALRARAEAAEARVAPRWQPIDTAVKDGTRILIVNDKGLVVVARWQSGWDTWHSVPGAYAVKPTHWMPLPSAPEVPKDSDCR